MKEIADNELYFLREKQPEATLINDQRFLDIERASQYKTPEYLKQSTILPVTLGFLPHEIKEILRSRGELLKS